MKKIGLTISLIALISTLTMAQKNSISATYGFKTMGSLRESRDLGWCGTVSRQTKLRQLSNLETTTKSLMATIGLGNKWHLAIGFQEDTKGYPFHDVTIGEGTEHIAFTGILMGFQYDILKKKHLVCHFNSYFTPEIMHYFNGVRQEYMKRVSVSYIGGIGADVQISRSFYLTTHVFGETAVMNYKLYETGNTTFFPVAFGINSGLKMRF
jgi:hypothetical protein